jgi:hypothetical protein
VLWESCSMNAWQSGDDSGSPIFRHWLRPNDSLLCPTCEGAAASRQDLVANGIRCIDTDCKLSQGYI